MNKYYLYSYRKILKLGFGKHYGFRTDYSPSRVGSYRPTYHDFYKGYVGHALWWIYRQRKFHRLNGTQRCKGYPPNDA